ncbi:protein-tyrosine phosphatase-like protein [Colletotrichum cereale]|nr:protein-tyrosine phosphatase-like protein [Colletotrichum cereale]
MPMTREQLERLAETDVRDCIPADVLLSALASSPFIPSDSLVNIRDLGSVPGSAIRPGLIYRCGTLEVAAKDPAALEWLARAVTHIFDIRSPRERERHPDPEVKGVTNTWFDSTVLDGQPVLEEFVEAGGAAGVRKEYLKILDIYQPTIRVILEHVRDMPGEPFLFHCTAGRDRTGVVAGLLQSLAGANPEDVRFDYMLSRIGTEPARERLLSYARIGTGVTFDHPGFYNMCNLRASCWDAFVAGVQEEHGGWGGYATGVLGFCSDDLARIRSNLGVT